MKRNVSWTSRRNRERNLRCTVCGTRVWKWNYRRHKRKKHPEETK